MHNQQSKTYSLGKGLGRSIGGPSTDLLLEPRGAHNAMMNWLSSVLYIVPKS